MKTETKNRHTGDCGRKEDLVAYLYDEASAAERASFERHLDDCDSCRVEARAFGRVRDDLSTWQVGFAPRAEISLPKRRLDVVREFFYLFPAWARGGALSAAAAALLLFAFSFAAQRIDFRGGQTQMSLSSERVESMVEEAVAKGRAQMQEEYRAQLAAIKTEHEAQLQALEAANRARLESVKAGLQAQIRKSNRGNPSIRSFFALDDTQDPLGDVRQ
jgi:anti-sigma factor RsiW